MAEAFDSIKYRDHNGVWWKIITPPGGRMFAHVDQDGGPLVYDPEPTDVGPVSRLRVAFEDPAAERQVLQQDIEAAVKDLNPTLKVTAAPDSGAWLVIVAIILLASDGRGPRGRR